MLKKSKRKRHLLSKIYGGFFITSYTISVRQKITGPETRHAIIIRIFFNFPKQTTSRCLRVIICFLHIKFIKSNFLWHQMFPINFDNFKLRVLSQTACFTSVYGHSKGVVAALLGKLKLKVFFCFVAEKL